MHYIQIYSCYCSSLHGYRLLPPWIFHKFSVIPPPLIPSTPPWNISQVVHVVIVSASVLYTLTKCLRLKTAYKHDSTSLHQSTHHPRQIFFIEFLHQYSIDSLMIESWTISSSFEFPYFYTSQPFTVHILNRYMHMHMTNWYSSTGDCTRENLKFYISTG